MTIVDINEINGWIDTGSSVLKLTISRAITVIEHDDERQITNFLKWMEQFKTGPPPGVMSKKFSEDGDQSSQKDQFCAAKKEEIEGLVERGALEIVKNKLQRMLT